MVVKTVGISILFVYMNYSVRNVLPFWFKEWDFALDCSSSCSLIFYDFFLNEVVAWPKNSSVQCIRKHLYVLSVCRRLTCFCFLAHPAVLHVPKPVLECRRNITVGNPLGYGARIILMRLVQAVFFFKK